MLMELIVSKKPVNERYGVLAIKALCPLPEYFQLKLRKRLTCKYLLAYNQAMDMDAVFKALADPTRRTLLDRLYAQNGQTLSELYTGLKMTRQAVTQHLALLEEANLVVTVWHGREKLHYLNPAPLQAIHKRWLDKYERHRLEALSDLKHALEREKTKLKEQPNG